jgi:spore coat protein A, manganese oxidase
MMITRRQLLQGAAATGAALLVPRAMTAPLTAWSAPAVFPNPLAVPPVLDVRVSGAAALTMRNAAHDFGLGIGPASTYCYQGAGDDPPTYLGPTLVAQRGTPLELSMANDLGEHPLAAFVDVQSVHGATEADRTAPRAATHLHGGNTRPDSDGGPEDTFTPGNSWNYTYDNDQESAGIWYHDHALGITRLNVYAGLAGGYLIRDANDPGEGSTGLPAGGYEVPLILQDRMFTPSGQLDYPLGAGTVWAPEMFGDVPTVNGTARPQLAVDRTRYRFRVFNGSNSRVYDLRLRVVTTGATLPFHQIGTDGGLLDAPVPLTALILSPGERADLLVDFSGLPAGARVLLSNNARTPYPNGPRALVRGGSPLRDVMEFTATGGFVAPPPLPGNLRAATHPVPRLSTAIGPSTRTRTMTLVEIMGALQPMMALLNNRMFHSEDYAAPDQHVQQNSLEVWELVNTTADAHPIHVHLVQFQVLNRQKFAVGGYLAAAYPGMMMEGTGAYPPPPVTPFLRGGAKPPAANEAGWKDTVLAMPGEVTRIALPFGQPAGLPPVASPRVWPTTEAAVSDYVWHCHILEHEDNDMMQRYRIA